MSVLGRFVSCSTALALAVAARAQGADPCLRCDVMYAVDCFTGLWTIDTGRGRSSLVGTLQQSFYDLAITSDGRLVGVTESGLLMAISACDASATYLRAPYFGNGLTGDHLTTDLFGQGPPLVRADSTGTGGGMIVGGTMGPSPPGWCGVSAGDLALSPTDGLLRTALECACAGGATSLQVVDPATADVVADAGCIVDAGGTPFGAVYGLAFDSTGTLWGAHGFSRSEILRIDPDTALAEVVRVTGGFDCGNGLACLPCNLPTDPCAIPAPSPADVGPALRVTRHGDPLAPDVTAWLDWNLDAGAPRPVNVHFHVYRGIDPRVLDFVPDPEPLDAAEWQDGTPAATGLPFVHFYVVRAADDCERESAD